MRKLKSFKFGFSGMSRVLLLIVLLVFFSLITDTFWSPGNWANITNILLYQVPVLMLLSMGMTMVIILRGIDLSIGAVVAFSSTLAAMIMKNTGNVTAGIAVGVLTGALIGAANGVLIALIRVPPYIATISTQYIFKGFTNIILQGRSIYQFPSGFKSLMQSTAFNYLIVAAVMALLIGFLLSKTVYGRKIYAVGVNEEAAKISGVRTEWIKISVYGMTGVLAALTGVIYMSFLGGVDANLGSDFPIRAISATLVGGTFFGGGKGTVTNAVVGSLIMLVLTNGMLHMGIPAVWQDVVIGCVIVLSVAAEKNVMVQSIYHKLRKKGGNKK